MTFFQIVKNFLSKILGIRSDEFFWKFRHFFDKNWAKSYVSETTINHPHRKLLVDEISKFYPFESVLEIGSASGANLFLLAKKFPKVSFYGIDVSSSAIKEGKKFFLKNEIKNVFLQNISANHLKIFKDKSIDVIFSDASMIYINKTQIDKVLKEMFRIAKKSIILCEQHTEDFPFYNTKWIHNYKAVVEGIIPKSRMNFIKISENIWAGDWEKYGYIIKIVL